MLVVSQNEGEQNSALQEASKMLNVGIIYNMKFNPFIFISKKFYKQLMYSLIFEIIMAVLRFEDGDHTFSETVVTLARLRSITTQMTELTCCTCDMLLLPACILHVPCKKIN